MNIKDVIRAWRDNSLHESLSRVSLTEEQRALLLENHLGEDLSEEELASISGGGYVPDQPKDSGPIG
ncbi:MAG TPA: bacteriocin [Ktedonobacteraceae bacterium]|nr:bacteriocin [Ktedonobacteraceae bacterium]